MKKIICILLTVFLLASMSTAAFAKIKAGEPVNYDKNGIKITYTEDFEKMKGTFLPYDMGLYYDGIGEILFFYYALSWEEFNILMEKPEDEWTEADKALMRGKQTRMSCVISINEGRGIPEIIELLNEDGDDTLLTEDLLKDREKKEVLHLCLERIDPKMKELIERRKQRNQSLK